MFFSNKKQGSKDGKGVFQSSVLLLANTAGVAAAFFTTGPLYTYSIDWVLVFSQQQYGEGLEMFIKPFWFILIAISMLGIARASITTVLTMGGLALADKIF